MRNSMLTARTDLAMNADDLREVVKYFRNEGRDPFETELRILDTYWSDHCRHTTFTTELENITVEESFVKDEIEGTLALYLKIRRELGREGKSICLMDLATIGARYLRSKGLLDDLEVSERTTHAAFSSMWTSMTGPKWLLQFRTETIPPDRDQNLSAGFDLPGRCHPRSVVGSQLRLSGDACDGCGKYLSTRKRNAARQIAPARHQPQGRCRLFELRQSDRTGHDPRPRGVSSRLCGQTPGGRCRGRCRESRNVRRESPVPGDVVLLLGGRTGRDNVGGATGSSKEHTDKSLEMCGSEVQKGNAPEERKLERLFRRPEVTRLIKKSNDFGAGGVSVAIGELTDGLDIYLDRVPTKYSGLNATKLAISESQERMAVVIEASAEEEFKRYCAEENIEVTHVADVTDSRRMRMYNKGKLVVDLSREFIDSAGAKHYAQAAIGAVGRSFRREVKGGTLPKDVRTWRTTMSSRRRG